MWCFCWLRCALFTAGFLPFWVGPHTCPSSLMLLAGSSESQRVDSWWIFIFIFFGKGMNFLWTGISQLGYILYVLLKRLITECCFGVLESYLIDFWWADLLKLFMPDFVWANNWIRQSKKVHLWMWTESKVFFFFFCFPAAKLLPPTSAGGGTIDVVSGSASYCSCCSDL